MDIAKIDVNFKLPSLPDNLETEHYSIEEKPFGIFGVKKENGKFRRMAESVACDVNDGVKALHSNTAGGRVLFKTNSRYIVLTAKMENCGKMPHFTTIGSAGFDLYIKNEFTSSFFPEYNISDGYSSVVDLKNNDLKEIVINFPLYSDVKEVYIGLEKGALIGEYNPYKAAKPIVYYGSSITQGGCASRPGNAYTAEITRRTNVDHINLGFSGSARGEKTIADYIGGLDMSIFVMDYDHNAPDVEWLKNTHEKFFKTVRSKNPDLPVVFVTRPNFYEANDDVLRRDVVFTTYMNAIKSGDENVYFVDGSRMFGSVSRGYCTVDGCHPNDLGFYMMAEHIGRTVESILNK